jgi:hypothetical protein
MPPAPVIGQTLQVVAVPGGQAAAFAFPGIAPGSAIGATIVWQPGGVASDNVYTTWPTALAAAVAASAAGNVGLAIDTSLAPAVIDNVGMPAGGWDMHARIHRIGGGSATFGPTVTIADGATLLNDPGASEAIVTRCLAGVSGLPSLSYTRPMVVQYDGSNLVVAGTAPAVLIGAGITVVWEMQTAIVQTAAAGAEAFSLAAGATLTFVLQNGASVSPATNLVRGAATATFLLARDGSSSSVLVTAAFTGTQASVLFQGPAAQNGDIATGVAGGLTFVVDATALTTGAFTQAIYCRGAAGAVTVQLPNPTLIGNQFRQFLIVDDDGTSGATPIVLTPFAGTNLNGAALAKNLSSNFAMWLVTMNGTSTNVAQLITAP